MLHVRYPIVVEGRYDKARLSGLVDAQIITTEGFGIFRDKDKLALLQRLASVDKLILLTDSDQAGFRIRSHIAGAVPPGQIIQIYIPRVEGKEQRKDKPSAEGTLGVEGMDSETLRRAFSAAGVLADGPVLPPHPPITRQQLFALGLSGGPDSATLRRRLLAALELPPQLSTNAICGILPRLLDYAQLETLVARLRAEADFPAKG